MAKFHYMDGAKWVDHFRKVRLEAVRRCATSKYEPILHAETM